MRHPILDVLPINYESFKAHSLKEHDASALSQLSPQNCVLDTSFLGGMVGFNVGPSGSSAFINKSIRLQVVPP
jgi:hypothetical protein